jgi:hypothetical protein
MDFNYTTPSCQDNFFKILILFLLSNSSRFFDKYHLERLAIGYFFSNTLLNGHIIQNLQKSVHL